MKHALVFTACVLGCAGKPPPPSPPAPTTALVVRPSAARPSPPRPLHTVAWSYGTQTRPNQIQVAHRVRTTGKTTTIAVGTPHASSPTAVLTSYTDFAARAIVRRSVTLLGCAAPPIAPSGYTVVGGSLITPPWLPTQIDPGAGRVVGLELAVELPCSGPWQAFLTGPVDGALRQRGATVTIREYAPIDRKAIDGMASTLPTEIVAAARAHLESGKALAILWGESQLGFAPVAPVLDDVRARVLVNESVECEVVVGRFEGSPLLYRRLHDGATDRSYLTAATPDPIFVAPGIEWFGTQQELAMLPPQLDTSCSADLRPKLARDRASALRLGVPAALLDEAGAIDFRTQSLVVFARPTSIEVNELPIGVVAHPPSCPGGRAPDPANARPRPAQRTPPRYVSTDDLAIARVIARGAAVPKLAFAPLPVEPCRPLPEPPHRH